MTFHYENNYNNSDNDFNNKVMLVAMFSLSFVILVVVILYIYARCAFRVPPRQRGISSPILFVDQVPTKTGLDPIVISSLPSFIFKQLDGQEHDECTICLSLLENDELVRELPNCNHIFHVGCIDKWLTGQSTCPVCRTEATPRLALLDREPPRGGEHNKLVVATTSNDDHQGDINKVISNNATGASSTSSSSRFSSFRKVIGRDRSFSSRRNQVNPEFDLESQGPQQ
ncbi:hypothetical protein vseg_018244 [Gypsophila vaccaria]